MDRERHEQAPSIAPILAVNFVGTLGFSIVLPFLVYLVTRLGGNALVYGVMGATYSFFQLVGASILGRWSDRYGRRRILLLSQLGTALSWGLFLVALMLPVTSLVRVESHALGAFTLTVPLIVLFAARALDGITGGNASVANAYLADVTTEEDRAANFGRLAISGNLGFVVGPALAGLLGATAWAEMAPATAAFLISVVGCVMILVGVPESHPCARERIPARSGTQRVLGQEPKDCFRGTEGRKTSLAEIARMPVVPRLLVLNLLVFLAFNVFYVVFPMYVVRAMHWTLAQTGTFFAVLSLLMVVAQGPILKRAAMRWSERVLVIGGSVLLAVSFLFFRASRWEWLYVGAVLLALGNGLMWPSFQSLLSRAAGPRLQGTVQGLAGSGAAIASIAGLLIGGVLFGSLGADVFNLPAMVSLLVCILGMGIGNELAPAEGERQ
ncbi:MAG: MFS transporter [Gemmatimonadetes bacterium]|nr:MFS transporter [Gemmatimonadota bacterium]